MSLDAFLFAATGIATLGYVAARPHQISPSLKSVEPLAVAISLGLVFIALHSATKAGDEADMELQTVLPDYHFTKHCEQRLGGIAAFLDGQASCERDGFVAASQKLHGDAHAR